MGNYIGLIHKDADSDFGASFPDFPGVVTAGTSLDDARAMAEEARSLHIDGLTEDGEAIPEPPLSKKSCPIRITRAVWPSSPQFLVVRKQLQCRVVAHRRDPGQHQPEYRIC